jgi:hypothetical protein
MSDIERRRPGPVQGQRSRGVGGPQEVPRSKARTIVRLRRSGLVVIAAAALGVANEANAQSVNPLTGRPEYVNPNTGNRWNNPISNAWDTEIYQRDQMQRMDAAAAAQRRALKQAIERKQAADEVKLRRDRTLAMGRERIRRGQAITRFAVQPFNLEAWLKHWNPKTTSERRQLVDECRIQGDIWFREAKTRGADLNDIGDTAALAFVIAYEVHSGGQRATPAAYKYLVTAFRDMWMKDEEFQGMSAAERQPAYDELFLNSTNPMRLWEAAKTSKSPAVLAKAKQEARDLLDVYWKGSIDTLRATPDRFTSLPDAQQPQ